MAIAAANKDSINTGVDASSFTSASITITNNNTGYMVCIYAKRDSGTITAPTVTGLGLTWTQEGASVATTRGRWLYKGQGTPSNGTVTLDFGAQTIVYCMSNIDEFTSVDQTDMTVQVSAFTSGSGTSGSVTLSAFGDATNNAAYGTFYHQAAEVTTHEGGYTELADVNGSYEDASGLSTEWKIGEDTAVTASWASSVNWRAFAAEIKMVAAAGDPLPMAWKSYRARRVA